MSPVPVLTGIRVTLRPPSPADIDARLQLGNDPEIHRMFGASRAQLVPLDRNGAAAWLRDLSRHPYAWVIDAGRFIGEIRLDRLDQADRRASLAVGIYDPASLGLGYGPEAIDLLLAYAFGTLGLHRIGLRVVAYNLRAIRAYAKCGFVMEGRERESAFVDGAWHDDIMMGILAADFVEGR